MLDREINRSLSQNIKHFVKQGKIMGSKGQLGLYDPNYERSSCGVGFITRKDSKQTHHLITLGHEALCSVPHRGGMSSEGVGDGAGISIDLSQDFFESIVGKPLSKGLFLSLIHI